MTNINIRTHWIELGGDCRAGTIALEAMMDTSGEGDAGECKSGFMFLNSADIATRRHSADCSRKGEWPKDD